MKADHDSSKLTTKQAINQLLTCMPSQRTSTATNLYVCILLLGGFVGSRTLPHRRHLTQQSIIASEANQPSNNSSKTSNNTSGSLAIRSSVECFPEAEGSGPSELIKAFVKKAVELIPSVGETLVWTWEMMELADEISEKTKWHKDDKTQNKCMEVGIVSNS